MSVGEISTVLLFELDVDLRSGILSLWPSLFLQHSLSWNLILSWISRYQETTNAIAACKPHPPCYCLASVEALETKVFDLSCLSRSVSRGMPGIPFVCSYPVVSADLTHVCPNKFCKVNGCLCLGYLMLFLML